MNENLIGLIEQAGIVGAGGAGFPTHVKLKAQADTVIINGAECEPLLRVDQQLMAGQAEALLEALDLMVEQVGAQRGVVALKEHYPAAVEALGEMGRRIRDMGLIPGTTVSVVGRAPLKDPVALRLSGVTVTLRNSEADHITIDVAG